MQHTNSCSYSKAKDVFSDLYDEDYVNISSSSLAYDKLVEILDKPIRLTLLYGKPGTGKTFLLKKIYRDFSKKKPIIFISTPFFSESEFVRVVYRETFGEDLKENIDFDKFFEILKKRGDKIEKDISILIDEAQLYPAEILEKIRLLSDTKEYKIVFTVHKTDQREDIFAKDYFRTRIWESIELKNVSFNEFKTYIEKKLLYRNMFDFVNKLSKKQYKAIYKYSKGNLRETNKMLYKLFDICEYYDMSQPSVLGNSGVIDTKFIEMAAISLGYIDA